MAKSDKKKFKPKTISTTPMMRQYLGLKKKHPDSLLFFRMGDFYEMFGEDAVVASKILGVALTSRDRKNPNAIPLCGIPYHALDNYLAKLIVKGHKVAICEQIEDPKLAKGLVKRDVVRVITPGTLLEDNLLSGKQNNYLMAIFSDKERIGAAFLDISTAEFSACEFTDNNNHKLQNELTRLEPKEILLPKKLASDNGFLESIKRLCSAQINLLDDWIFEYNQAYGLVTERLNTLNLEGFGAEGLPLATCAAGAALYYAQDTQKASLEHIHRLRIYHLDDYMLLDAATLANLELTCSAWTKERKNSLLGVMDHTVTAMGARRLKNWLLHPLLKLDDIISRHEAVEELYNNGFMRRSLRDKLEGIHDLQRLISRISIGTANARDMLSLGASLALIPDIKKTLLECKCNLIINTLKECDDLSDIVALTGQAIADNPPLTLKEGGLIKTGYNRELDELRNIRSDGKSWIARLELQERKRTGISSLKVRYNKVFGYYIEITKANLDSAPDDYIRKQTLVNSERFITPELKEYEEKVLGAQERICELEFELFCDIRNQVAAQSERIQSCAHALAILDCLACLAELAHKSGYVRPVMDAGSIIKITEGRHPVIERLSVDNTFIANDTYLDNNKDQLLIITGPNMAGKSTYIRQVAQIILMAQMGSFIPAESARLGVVDRIFTRVGASDNLVKGQSTFMVEMGETANILNNATNRSLIILDEIGRGTSTYDGLSIAWAVAEYIHNKKHIGAKTLFATHYHELTDLSLTLKGVKNYNAAVKEWDEQIVFLYKVVQGGASRSYGIQVAKLAGLPNEVIQRAKEILCNLESQELNETGRPKLSKSKRRSRKKNNRQLSLFLTPSDTIVKQIKNIDLSAITPLEALNRLAKWQKDLQEEE